MPRLLLDLNVESGHPDVMAARKRMLDGIASAKSSGQRAVRVIHGYGSSGVGGTLRSELRKTLARLRNRGDVRLVLFGERFTFDDPLAREAIEILPELSRDSDYNRGNEGITIIIL